MGVECQCFGRKVLAERDKRIEAQLELDILKADHAAEAGQQSFFRRAEINFCKIESMELIPTLGDPVLTQKMAATKDTFIMSRTILTALSQDPPDVELATDLAGQLCRLANNSLVGFKIATGPNIDPKKNYAVPDLYYETTGPAAKRTKHEWLPPPQLEIDVEQRKELLKLVKPPTVAEAIRSERRQPGGGNGGSGGSKWPWERQR